jgi:hypothetical protein
MTPEKLPDAPTNIRMFLAARPTHSIESDGNVIPVILRWDEPVNINGVLKGYSVWKTDGNSRNNWTRIGSSWIFDTEIQYELKKSGDLIVNNLSIRVECANSLGSNWSEVFIITSDELQLKQLPTLLIANQDSLEVN